MDCCLVAYDILPILILYQLWSREDCCYLFLLAAVPHKNRGDCISVLFLLAAKNSAGRSCSLAPEKTSSSGGFEVEVCQDLD